MLNTKSQMGILVYLTCQEKKEKFNRNVTEKMSKERVSPVRPSSVHPQFSPPQPLW